MPDTDVRILLVGDDTAAEMRPVVEFLRSSGTSSANLRHAAHIADARRLSQGWQADLVVVLQTWSNQFSAGDVREILGLFPLARLVWCGGAWCDSDGRTRAIWPPAARVRVEGAVPRLLRELAYFRNPAAADRQPGAAGKPLPLTASRSEIFEHDFDDANDSPDCEFRARVEVRSPDRQFRGMLSRAFRKVGFVIRTDADREPPDVIVWDADPWDESRWETLQRLSADQVNPGQPIVACAGFLRVDLVEQLESRGAKVWFKLAPLTGLFATVASAAEPAPRRC